jgi:hypothetical protein
MSSCVNCGADLARFIRKPPKLPPVQSQQPAAPAQSSNPTGQFNLGLGIVGAFAGALIGVGLMFGFYLLVGFRFPLLGVGIGALTGLGGRKLFKGTDHSLGLICGGIALVAVVGTLFLMYGEFPILSIISVIVSVSVAYRISGHS